MLSSQLLSDGPLALMLGYINDGPTYKAAIFTCKQWHRVMTRAHPSKPDELCNHLCTLIMRNPDAPWHYKRLSSNPAIHLHTVLRTPHRPWNKAQISELPS